MNKRILAMILAMGMLLLMLAGCGTAPAKNPAVGPTAAPTAGGESDIKKDDYVMKIVTAPALCGAPLFIGMELGYLTEFGVNYEHIRSESNQWDLMAAGKNDMAFGLLPTFIQRIANGFDMYVTMGAHYGCINVVASDVSGIQSISELAGKRVGIPGGMGSDPAILLQRMLVAYGVEIQDVDLQVFSNADLAAALQQGHIEAFVSWDPYATLVSQQEGNHLIFNQAEDEATKDEFCCIFGLRPEFVEEHPEVAKNFSAAMAKACEYIAANPVEAAKICYEKGYIADADYEFNGILLDSYRYQANFEEAKASFVRVTEDLRKLDIISLNMSGQELADKVFVNVGEMK